MLSPKHTPSHFSQQAFVHPEYLTPNAFSRCLSLEDQYRPNPYSNAYSPDTPISPIGTYEGYFQDCFSPSPLATGLTHAEAVNVDSVDVSISTAFHPGSKPTPDTLLSSSDGVVFYIHSQTVMAPCPTAFEPYLSGKLSDPQFRNKILYVDATSVELNIILHALYGTSPAANSPDIKALVQAVDRMPKYGIPPHTLILPSTPLHDLLLSHGPLHPIDVYALAAHHGLSHLALGVSSHLLSYNLADISDELAERIGAVYLKKLLMLHAERSTSLKSILLHPPHPHAPTKKCGFEEQKKLTRAWALVSAYLVWDARPDLSTHNMKSTLNPLMEHLTCDLCHQGLDEKIRDVVVQWATVKVKYLLSIPATRPVLTA